MRRLVFALALVGWSATAYAATIEPPQDVFRLKVLEEQGDGQWYGHRHWLYDKENQPQSSQPQTDATASRPSDCAEYRVRVPKAGAGAGTGTEIKRTEKCD